MKRGKFITIEGCEGAGKSTQIELLKSYYTGEDFVFTREPGGTTLGEGIRDLLLSTKYNPTALTELFLYCSARCELVETVIRPALESGKNVICDRFIDSSFAYQGYGRGLEPSIISTLNEIILDGIMPDLTMFIDLEPIDAFKRKGGADKEDRIDSEHINFHNKVYLCYRQLSKTYTRFGRVDGKLSKEEIFAILKHRIDLTLSMRG